MLWRIDEAVNATDGRILLVHRKKHALALEIARKEWWHAAFLRRLRTLHLLKVLRDIRLALRREKAR